MGVDANYSTINYRDQREFDYFFATAFDRYDRNRDGRIDYNEFQPLINDMCQMIGSKYGYGPTLDKIRQAWNTMDFNRSGYITRQEFSTRAKYEIERILSQPSYGPPGTGYAAPPHYAAPPQYGAPPHYAAPPQYGAPQYAPPPQYGAPPQYGYGPNYVPPAYPHY